MPRDLRVNPQYAPLLSNLGLRTVADFLKLEGAIISGHPDRHVMRLSVGGVPYYLKREHRVPLRDRLASFAAGVGFVSVSLREAQTLQTLASAGIRVPEWMAAGETRDGRAFLLLKDVGPALNLREYVRQSPPLKRRHFARRLAHAIAAIHNAGVTYPDLYAKHILVTGESFTFLDWQRSRRRSRLTWHERCRDLAALDASLPDDLVGAEDRLTFLLAYAKASSVLVPMRAACALIQRRKRKLLRRSSIREQRLPLVRASQALHWLDGERLCLTDAGRAALEPSELGRLAYDSAPGQTQVRCAGHPAVLTTRRSVRPFARDWQSPECRRAAELLREERLGKPPRLLAFGQWRRGWGRVDSFLLHAEGGNA